MKTILSLLLLIQSDWSPAPPPAIDRATVVRVAIVKQLQFGHSCAAQFPEQGSDWSTILADNPLAKLKVSGLLRLIQKTSFAEEMSMENRAYFERVSPEVGKQKCLDQMEILRDPRKRYPGLWEEFGAEA